MLRGRATNAGKRLGKVDHLFVFRFIAGLPPAVVVAVLLSSAVVASDGLDVATRIGADPDSLPSRRNDEVADAHQRFEVVDRIALGVVVDELFASFDAADSARRIG